ncbi:GNAT family N-acetyltransferase [Yoonia vestfoldensis]|jgi:ribosomal-protein-alanine N-acetyltransferase|uniref:Putative ribosomal N-acetyltransferase YdaF n=1 Tax=Yoonia vestfoldensis TaxID=245188 RepID=A0A1Y0EAB3_9RHOB|nr:GNAT family N-acetyltransferase [Yoonia vestfoldensis]ARU00567.1 putative ribosomal N-acetyltransferase YdaF [Yoonia vestfoldensis]
MRLTTDRLILRGPRADDLEAMFAIFSDPATMKHWSTLPHADRSVTQAALTQRIAAFAASPTYFQIEMQGNLIGCAGLYKNTEIGFILQRGFWRQGIVSEAMRAIIPYLFATTDLPQLTADVDPGNAASIGVLHGLGFRETHRAAKTYFIGGIWYDSVYLALQRPS